MSGPKRLSQSANRSFATFDVNTRYGGFLIMRLRHDAGVGGFKQTKLLILRYKILGREGGGGSPKQAHLTLLMMVSGPRSR